MPSIQKQLEDTHAILESIHKTFTAALSGDIRLARDMEERLRIHIIELDFNSLVVVNEMRILRRFISECEELASVKARIKELRNKRLLSHIDEETH